MQCEWCGHDVGSDNFYWWSAPPVAVPLHPAQCWEAYAAAHGLTPAPPSRWSIPATVARRDGKGPPAAAPDGQTDG